MQFWQYARSHDKRQSCRRNLGKRHSEKASSSKLNKCIDICRASETTSKQLKEMTRAEEVGAITTGNPKSKNVACPNKGGKPSKVHRPAYNKPLPQIKCKFCHKTHPRKKELCPAWQRRYNDFPVAFSSLKHVACSTHCSSLKANKQHSTRQAHSVEQKFQEIGDSEDSDDYLLSVESIDSLHAKNSPKKIYASMRLRFETVKLQLDCGATVNILPADIYKKVLNNPQMTPLQKTQTTLVMFNKSELKPLGCVKIETLNPTINSVSSRNTPSSLTDTQHS